MVVLPTPYTTCKIDGRSSSLTSVCLISVNPSLSCPKQYNQSWKQSLGSLCVHTHQQWHLADTRYLRDNNENTHQSVYFALFCLVLFEPLVVASEVCFRSRNVLRQSNQYPVLF